MAILNITNIFKKDTVLDAPQNVCSEQQPLYKFFHYAETTAALSVLGFIFLDFYHFNITGAINHGAPYIYFAGLAALATAFFVKEKDKVYAHQKTRTERFLDALQFKLRLSPNTKQNRIYSPFQLKKEKLITGQSLNTANDNSITKEEEEFKKEFDNKLAAILERERRDDQKIILAYLQSDGTDAELFKKVGEVMNRTTKYTPQSLAQQNSSLVLPQKPVIAVPTQDNPGDKSQLSTKRHKYLYQK